MIKGNAPTQPQQNQDSRRLKQVKVSVAADIASAFKGACAVSGASMASELSRFMADYSKTGFSKRKPPPDYSTKRQRRAAIHKFVRHLEQIRDCEEQYRDRIPENLQGAAAFDSAEEFISSLETAIEALDYIASI